MATYKNSFKTKKNIKTQNNQTDKVYTPQEIANYIIKDIDNKFGISGKILEPCLGGGSFYKAFDLIKGRYSKEWCEIDKGKNFFDYKNKTDWIITNPPYSIFDDFLKHSMELSDNIVLLIPIAKLTSSYRRIIDIKKYGGVKYINVLKGNECNFPFGFAIGCVYIQKNYKGGIDINIKDGTK